jgi:hypothetical protein
MPTISVAYQRGMISNAYQPNDRTPLQPELFTKTQPPTGSVVVFSGDVQGNLARLEVSGNFSIGTLESVRTLKDFFEVDLSVSKLSVYINNILIREDTIVPSILSSDLGLSGTKQDLEKQFIGNDSFIGAAGLEASNDIIDGFSGNDRIQGNGDAGLTREGDPIHDVLIGGIGLDTAVYRGKRVDYQIAAKDSLWDPTTETNSISGWLVIDSVIERDGEDEISQIERLEFSDLTVALDTGGVAGKAYRIYKAAFDRTPDATGLGYWIDQMDSGMDEVEVAARFIDSAEFRQLYGSNVSNATFITNVYNNVLDRNPDDTGLAWWVSEMQTNPSKTWQKVLADFSESAENKANVVSLIASGIAYDPWE